MTLRPTLPAMRFLGLALALWILLHFHYRHYPERTLSVDGILGPGQAWVVEWDTGRGFNEDERARLGGGTTSVRLPSVTIRAARITGAYVESKHVTLVTPAGQTWVRFTLDPQTRIITLNPRDINRPEYPFTLILIQTGLALLLAGILRRAYDWLRAGRTLGFLFREKQRWVFWAMFAFSSAVFLLWLLGQWPGGITPDSRASWLEAKTLQLTDWHPYLYQVYILALLHFWDNPAVIPVFQLLATALLGSWILHTLLLEDRRLWPVVAVCFLLFSCSPAIGAMNVMIWKDVPHTLCVVGLSFWLWQLGVRRAREGQPVRIRRFLLPGVLLAGALFLRHNGIVLLALAPAILFVLVDRRSLLLMAALLAGIFAGGRFVLPALLHVARADSTLAVMWKLNPVLYITSQPGYRTASAEADAAVIARFIPPAVARENFDPMLVDPVFFHEQFRYKEMESVPPADWRAFEALFSRLLRANPGLFLRHRWNMAWASLTLAHRDMVLVSFNDEARFSPRGYAQEYPHLRHRTVSAPLAQATDAILMFSKKPIVRQIAWMLLPPFALALSALIFVQNRGGAWVFALPSLCLVLAGFATIPAVQFRYFYHLHLLAYFLPPMLFLHLLSRKQTEEKPHGG